MSGAPRVVLLLILQGLGASPPAKPEVPLCSSEPTTDTDLGGCPDPERSGAFLEGLSPRRGTGMGGREIPASLLPR